MASYCLKRWLAFLLLLAPTLAHAQNETVSYLPGMLLGRGFDTATGAVKEDCTTFGTASIPAQGVGLVSYNFSDVASSQDLYEATSVSAGASVNTGLYSASAEMSLLSQSQVSSFTANFLAWVSVERNWDYATGTALKPDFATLHGSNASQFGSRCGDRYVGGVLLGGEFYGLITVQTQSQTDRDEVSAAVRGSYGPFNANASITVETREALASHQTSITGYKSGGTGTPLPLTIEQMQALAAGFPAEVQASGGVPVRVLLMPYPAQPFDPLTAAMDQLAALRWDYVTVAREATYIIAHPTQFYMTLTTWRNFLEARRQEADAAATTLSNRIATCRSSPSTCSAPSGLRAPDLIRATFPPRYASTCATVNFGPWSMGVYPLNRHCGGDNEMDGNNPSIQVDAKPFIGANGLEVGVETYVKMKEGKHDWTCFDQNPWARRTFVNLAVTHPGCYVAAVADLQPNSGELRGSGGSDNHNWTDYTNGIGLVSAANCRSDTGGHDDGELGCRSVSFAAMRAKLTHEELRMGPNDLSNQARAMWRVRLEASNRLRLVIARQDARLAPAISQMTGAPGTPVAPRLQREVPKTIKPELRILQPGHPPVD